MPPEPAVTIASNRGPVSFLRGDDGWELKRGAGGLAGAVDPVARRLGDRAAWIFCATSDEDRAAADAGQGAKLQEVLGYEVEVLQPDPDTYSAYYDNVSNRLLWFAHHCLWEEIADLPATETSAADLEAYDAVNALFAEHIAQRADTEIVLFQDYHLSTAPQKLRALQPEASSLHFTHSSFCGPAGLARLPAAFRRQVIDGLLGADLVGFHTRRWCEGFLRAAEDEGYAIDAREGKVLVGERAVWVRAYPIPVDAPQLTERAARPGVEAWVTRLLDEHRDKTIVVRADRIEPSKNIVRGFEAFGALLDEDPSLASETHFIACLYPSRGSMPEYQTYMDRCIAAADEVRDRHPGSITLLRGDDFDRTLASYRIYDVLVVNPLMDGMNLVSKEGPLLNERDGALVLSRGAGSFEELGRHAFVVDDPADVESIAAGVREALAASMPARRSRAEELRRLVRARSPRDWIEEQLEDIQEIRGGGVPARPF